MIFIYLILLVYAFLIFQLAFGIKKKIKEKVIIISEPKTTFTIIVPFRNEEKNLPFLLNSIEKLNYPKDLFEIILVDDESTDNWKLEKEKWKISIVTIKNQRKSNSPKKDAIETAIKIAQFDWIVTTDADCEVPESFLQVLDAEIQNKDVKMCIGSVQYKTNKGFLHNFQNNDFLSLQGITAGSFGITKPFMCNGANFSYSKDFFMELNGFDGNNKLASGDDVFLLQKALKCESDKISYLGNLNIVLTKSCKTWKELINQRVRWASKTTAYAKFYPKFLGIIVFLTCLCCLIVTFFAVFNFELFKLTLIFLLIKFFIDYLFLKISSNFFKIKFYSYIGSFIIYPYFTILVILKAAFGKFEWKERRF